MRVAVLELEDIDRILKKDQEEAVEELLDQVKDYYGEIPYIMQFMKDMPDVLIPKVIYDNSIMREIKRLDRKTIELISIGVSAALRCTHCLDMHLRVAKRMDIPRDEIFDAILIAGTLSNASVLAYGTRAMDADQNEKECQTQDDEKDTCDVCNITGEVE